MTSHNPPSSASPVHVAAFADGPDLILVNPHVPDRVWRREQLRAATHPVTILSGLIGVALAAIGIASTGGGVTPPLFGIGAAVVGVTIIGASAVTSGRRRHRLVTGHRHHRGRSCRLERNRGDFFFRAAEFRPFGPATDHIVRQLLAAVDELHRTPARAWIDPALPGEAHRVVWQALCCLDRTRNARAISNQLVTAGATASETDTDARVGGWATAAREAIVAVDAGITGVVGHLRGCVVLTRAWEAKLRRAGQAIHDERTLTGLIGRCDIDQTLAEAEALPQTVFAHLTAARDITGAGPFPWQRPQTQWATQPCRPHPGRASTTHQPGEAS